MTGPMNPDDRQQPRAGSTPGFEERSSRPPREAADELFDSVVTDLGILLSTQIDLAKLELREEAVRAGRAARSVALGFAVAFLAAAMLSVAAAWALADVVGPASVGFVVVGVVDAALAGVVLWRARGRVRAAGVLSAGTEAVEPDVGRVSQRAG